MTVMTPLKVLFLCIGNSCRSPMAEAMANSLGGGRVEAHSAGLAAIDHVSAGTVHALEALGYPSEGLTCKDVRTVAVEEMDVIVSLIGRDAFTYLPGHLPARRVAWSIRDPFGEDDEVFHEVAHQIERRVRSLIRELARELPTV